MTKLKSLCNLQQLVCAWRSTCLVKSLFHKLPLQVCLPALYCPQWGDHIFSNNSLIRHSARSWEHKGERKQSLLIEVQKNGLTWGCWFRTLNTGYCRGKHKLSGKRMEGHLSQTGRTQETFLWGEDHWVGYWEGSRSELWGTRLRQTWLHVQKPGDSSLCFLSEDVAKIMTVELRTWIKNLHARLHRSYEWGVTEGIEAGEQSDLTWQGA